MTSKEIIAKNILSPSKIFSYALNPYLGCEHDCKYCYARFMKRFTGHKEKWGEFVDVKINAPELLIKEIRKRRVGRVWVSGVCDPYQPIEAKYELTKECLEILARKDWPVTIQTKSPLILRDLQVLKKFKELEVGFTITTAAEEIRKIFEPNSPAIAERLAALAQLHAAGIKTFAMVAPLLPGVEDLVEELKAKIDYVFIDRMNYHYADWVYRKHKIEWARKDEFFMQKGEELKELFTREAIPCHLLF